MVAINKEFEIVPYSSQLRGEWNEFVRNSRNGTFLFDRDYMEYHSDRFKDASLMALRNGKTVALLPACLQPGDILSSHAGLTYGGWILPPAHLDGAMLSGLFREWIDYCHKAGYRQIDYKPTPSIYHRTPSQEDIYSLWRFGFTTSTVNLSSAIDLRYPWKFNMSKRQQLRKALNHEPVIEESSDYESFWQILTECLSLRHQAAPVHSLEEIKTLAEKFPGNIRLFILSDNTGSQAGVIIYDTGITAHSQYAATTALARERYYLTALYHKLISEVFKDRAYFDFGTSNEEGGKVLNAGLLNQKFSMGATGIAYPRYTLTLS